MRSARNSRRKDSNQNLLETPQTNRLKLKEKEKLSQDIKAKYIQDLEERNRKLKYEIIKINEMLQEQKEKPQKKEHRLIPHDSSAEVVKKQLQNVYKQIKNYEREISNLENKQGGGLLTDKMARLQNIYNEKTAHLQKLKGELSQLTKVSLDNQKKLKNNAGKQELENQMLKYNEEIKLLREKVREAELKENKKMENAKKQYDYIKKLERELIENGVSIEELQEMKRNNIYNQIYEKMNNKDAANQPPKDKPKEPKNQQPKEENQQMTVERYMELKNETKLYKKLHLDYDKRLQALEKERSQQEKLTQQTKVRIKEKDEQIQKIQTEIIELKARIKKTPNTPSVTKVVESKDKKRGSQKERIVPARRSGGSPSNSASNQINLKYDEKGQVSDRGSRFTDRSMLGKNINSRIIAVKVWTQKSSCQICGIQCFYRVNDQLKPGTENIMQQFKSRCTQNSMELVDGDYIKSISGNLSQNNIVEYLVVISKDSQIGRFGMVKPTQKQFNFNIGQDQIPVCLYGSVCKPHSRNDCCLIEQIGFEIGPDKEYNKGDKFI